MATQSWYYSYDPDTKKYTGMVLADEQPEFATTVPIDNISNPVWNAAENSWDGDNIQQMFDDIQNSIGDGEQSPASLLQDLVDKLDGFQKTTMTTMTSITTSLADLTKRVESLEKGGN